MQNHSPRQAAEEVCRLVDSACDGVLSETERLRLNELLDQGVEMRAVYLQYMALHSALKTTAGKQAVQGIDEFAAKLLRLSVAPEAATLPIAGPIAGRELSTQFLRRAAVLAAVLIPAGILAVKFGGGPSTLDLAPRHAAVSDAATEPTAEAGSPASVTRVADDVRWVDPNDSYAAEAMVPNQGTLRLSQGEIELRYATGARLVLVGPAEFVVRATGGVLRRGGLMASVPREGHGFTIDTPTGQVIDLGTRFGVVVDDFGVSEVSVFEGKVEALPKFATSSARAHGGKIELSEGSALQWGREMFRPLKADPRRLPVSLVSFSHSSDEDLPASPDNTSRRGMLSVADSGDWKSMGSVTRQHEAYVLTGRGKTLDPPYLVSSKEIDPTNGPVTIICEATFPDLKANDDPSIAVLTRCEDARSGLERPWKNALATSVRCNFRTTPDRGDGLLETATKYERDRELTGISWRGFQRPERGATYRIVMRDDGVNVRFTVSQVGKPAVMKSVTCRSLFRGYKNFLALEGWSGGTTVVDHIQVYQEPSASNVAGRFPSLHKNAALALAPTAPIRPTGLLGLVPADAELAIAEDFAGPAIDKDRWATLGHVAVADGSAALGDREIAKHIDTFHPRPYLITREKFDPADGAIFVAGEIEFAPNFLQGYGGSFAVMTRADRRYGAGPEWAVSALATGVRANFWPAASRSNHILELHAKPTATTLEFLTGSALEIDPRSRRYNFLLKDDGRSTALTIQDAETPGNYGTVECATSSPDLKNGFIAFESCWGSPTTLDNVHIYRQRREAPKPNTP